MPDLIILFIVLGETRIIHDYYIQKVPDLFHNKSGTEKNVQSKTYYYDKIMALKYKYRGRGRIRTGVKRFCRPWTKPLIPHARQLSEPLIRFELTTCALRMRCSTDWAKVAFRPYDPFIYYISEQPELFIIPKYSLSWPYCIYCWNHRLIWRII